ncbi:MAG: hypothetical protein IPK50_01590 [Fibrobacterota bacterium]|nr:hypothetical protein [Fibrobacterota bacterium]QQS05596.1 MAG: hypothetical protein IPK50_01590 [Fibrobacterota bacterium]
MNALLEIDQAQAEIDGFDDSAAPRTLQEALAHWELQARRNQRIRDRYESSQGRCLLVRRASPATPAFA